MINLTRYDNQNIELKATDINRIRQTDKHIDGPNGESRVDSVIGSNLYKDLAADVAAAVVKEVHSFISLMQPGGEPVWFDGAKASGPSFVRSPERIPVRGSGKINSALIIANKLQYVRNTPQQVYDAIKAQGGQAIPPDQNNFAKASKEIEGGLDVGPPEVWDDELYSESPTS